MLDIVRYARGGNTIDVFLGDYLNFHHLTTDPQRSDPQILLESGINRIAPLQGPDGRRRPALNLRSSPWKVGHETTPWEDVYDLDHGHVRYFGDHKPSVNGPVGSTAGNAALLEAWELHASPSTADRALAPPLLLWRATPVNVPGSGTIYKGHLEFCGVAVIERLEIVVQREPRTTRTFPNLVVDLAVLDLTDTDDTLDWRWIDDRRTATLTATGSARYAPAAWNRWVRDGKAAIPRVRRRVLSSRVMTSEQQRPPSGSPDARLLQQIYEHFESHKHRFEHLAATAAAQIFEKSGASYQRGWLTRAGGDGGMDFVGRLDAGNTTANTPLVVLGQAKCIKPSNSISPDEVARVVARLRRGWIGIFVTTGVFSKQAQVEMIDDEYPIVLVPGAALVKEVRELAELAFAGDVAEALRAASADYDADITHRRPEEILAG
jgi:hypothetical protein